MAITSTWTTDVTTHGQIRCTASIKLCNIYLKYIFIDTGNCNSQCHGPLNPQIMDKSNILPSHNSIWNEKYLTVYIKHIQNTCASPCPHFCAKGFGYKPAPCTIQQAKGLAAEPISNVHYSPINGQSKSHNVQIYCWVEETTT